MTQMRTTVHLLGCGAQLTVLDHVHVSQDVLVADGAPSCHVLAILVHDRFYVHDRVFHQLPGIAEGQEGVAPVLLSIYLSN